MTPVPVQGQRNSLGAGRTEAEADAVREVGQISVCGLSLGSGELDKTAVFQSKVQADIIQLYTASRHRVLAFGLHRYLAGWLAFLCLQDSPWVVFGMQICPM